MSSVEYQFIDNELIKYLQCSICESVMKTPTRLHPCGHSFCEQCCKFARNCASCKAKIQARQSDLTAINLISDLTVKCTAKDCPFRGSYEAFMLNHKNACSMRRCGGIEAWISEIKNSLDRGSKGSQQQGGRSRKEEIIDQADEIVMPEAVINAEDLEQSNNKQKNQRGSRTHKYNQKVQNQEQTFIQCIELDNNKRQVPPQLKDQDKTKPEKLLRSTNKLKPGMISL